MIYSVFADSNIFLDAYLERGPHDADCKQILSLAVEKEIIIYTSSSCLLTVMYFLKKDGLTRLDLIKVMTATLKFCKILDNTESHFLEAFSSGFNDLEDAIQYHTALAAKDVDYFLTSNIKEYKKASPQLAVLSPKQFIALYRKK